MRVFMCSKRCYVPLSLHVYGLIIQVVVYKLGCFYSLYYMIYISFPILYDLSIQIEVCLRLYDRALMSTIKICGTI